MVSIKFIDEINDAVSNPGGYVKGAGLAKLRAAFDAMSSQVCHEVTGYRPRNRMMARSMLNERIKEGGNNENIGLISALTSALRECEHTIFRKDYIDNSGSIEGFISRELVAVLRELK